jgi:acetolactate synthase-1/2/3 large subunit
MNVSDAVIRFLEEIGLGHVFTLSGGGIMYLLDSLGRSQKLRYVCNYHEQACAIAADGYARVNGFGACFVTCGPGAVNALSGVVGAWYDSIPILVVSGQVRSNLVADYSKVRQIGPQEGNVLDMVRPVTKYSVSLHDPKMILFELEKAHSIAKSGRPGPVWLELPLDMQAAEVEWHTLPRWSAEPKRAKDPEALHIPEVVTSLKCAKRPVLVLGNGVRLASMHETALNLVAKLRIPTLLPYTGKDLMDQSNPYLFGVFGTSGQRHSNIILQNSDLILGLGVGFCVAKTGFEVKKFASNAKKIVVDIDPGQLTEHPLQADTPILSDLKDFLPALLDALKNHETNCEAWLSLCEFWEQQYPGINSELFRDESYVNSYVFMDTLSNLASEGDVIVTGNGLDCVSFYQEYKIKAGQRSLLNGNWGSMGWDLPTAVGAYYATGRRILCITGDGSLMLNSQELLTIGANKLPVKVFVFNNGGYGSIKATQNNFFQGRFVGCGPSSNVYNPNFSELAKAFGCGYKKISSHSKISELLDSALTEEGPFICEVMISPDQWITPKATSFKNSEGKIESKPLDDMAPFLPAEEIEENRRLAKAL